MDDPVYAYLPLFKGSWNMQEHWDLDIFWFNDGRICGVFPPLCVFSLGNRLASFLIAPKNCIFWGASFELTKKPCNFVPQRVSRFSLTLLYHCYTIIYTCIHTHTQGWVIFDIYMYVYICIHTDTLVYIYIHISIYTDTTPHSWHEHAYIYLHIHTHIHIHTLIYT